MVAWFPPLSCSKGRCGLILLDGQGSRGQAAALCESALSSAWGWQRNQLRTDGNGLKRRLAASVPCFLNRKSKRKGTGVCLSYSWDGFVFFKLSDKVQCLGSRRKTTLLTLQCLYQMLSSFVQSQDHCQWRAQGVGREQDEDS